MRAIQSTSLGRAEIVDAAEPQLQHNSILVRPYYVGCNPCDFICTDVDMLFRPNQTLGVDYAGVVEQVGADVDTQLKPGDRVCGAVAASLGGHPSPGCYADLVLGYGHFVFPVPEKVSMEQAASFGVALSTIAMSFYQDFGLPLPDEQPGFGGGKPFFVFGGSTVTGMWAIQFAKLSGFRVVTVCSPRNFDLVKSYGADEVYDYHDVDQCISQIKASVGDDLHYVYNCVMNPDEARLSSAVLSSKGGTYVTIVPSAFQRADVRSAMTWGQSCMADEYKAGPSTQTATPEQKALGVRLWNMALQWLDEGKLKTPPIDLRRGLEGVLEGMEELRAGKVSGRKVVSRLV